ncbi:MAG: class II fumarate hydratase [Burkholderiaceae bacterium]|nr:class II fumarate hydratase [Burkholderiaceae bacterium]
MGKSPCASRPQTATVGAPGLGAAASLHPGLDEAADDNMSVAGEEDPGAALDICSRRSGDGPPGCDISGRRTRVEVDSFGPIEVPADALWGAQTERSRHMFAIGTRRMPLAIVHALAEIKRAAAEVHLELALLGPDKASAIAAAAARVAAGEYDTHFPLSVWQTGSGTQTHMNVNEVVANLASLALGGGLGAQRKVHPNDDVNRGQSSNDVFPTAMHVAVVLQTRPLLAALGRLRSALRRKAAEFAGVIKIGRTHLQDATPLTLGQEFGGYAAQLTTAEAALRGTLPAVHALAIGGTAVGTGMNTHPEFGQRVAKALAARLGEPFFVAPNLFAAMAGHEALVSLHGALRTLCVALTKIAGDIRLMGSGPRAGIGELRLPANEPGSSIMPGKVNPTQVEALTMVCAQVMGHDVAIGIAASQGHFELNVYKPLIACDVLDSLSLLGDAMESFSAHCVEGIEVDTLRTAELLQRSLMLVTALAVHIGYDRAAEIAKAAQLNGWTLREAAMSSGAVSAADFDAWVRPEAMVGGWPG